MPLHNLSSYPTQLNTHAAMFLVDFLEKSFIIVLLQKHNYHPSISMVIQVLETEERFMEVD